MAWRSAMRSVAAVLLSGVCLWTAVGPGGAAAAGYALQEEGCAMRGGTVTAERIVTCAAAAEPVLMDGVRVTGDLDFGTAAYAAPVVVTGATFGGGVRANFASFAATVDLSGSTFTDAVSLTDVRFEGRVRLPEATFEKDVAFDRTVFSDEARFIEDRFLGSATFTEAKFSAGASFIGATFSGNADFGDSAFGGLSEFRSTKFRDGFDFRRDLFSGAADFQLSELHQTAAGGGFSDARFGAVASFVSSSFFDASVDFSGAVFSTGADFDFAFFGAGAGFLNATSAGKVSMANSRFEGMASLDQAAFASLDLTGVEVAGKGELHMADVRASSLRMDLSDMDSVQPVSDRTAVLRLIERTAREDGDLTKANHALFRRNVLRREDSAFPLSAVLLAWEWSSGYGVEPWHVLSSLAVIMVLDVVLSSVAGLSIAVRGPRTWPGFVRHVMRRVARSLRPATPPVGLMEFPVGLARWAEWAVFKVLIAVLLINLANYSPPIREAVHALGV